MRLISILAIAILSLSAQAHAEDDPLEGINRGMWAFNKAIDNAVIKPAANAYAELPNPVIIGIGNFFGNLADIPGTLNLALQGRIGDAASNVGRVLINTTVGIVGLIDVAGEIGLEKTSTDFGHTLATWGVGEGAYVVLPLLGPSTIRDTGGKIVDFNIDPVAQHRPIGERNAAIVTRGIHERHELLPADKIISEAALDEYAFVRGAWLQKRRNDTGTKNKYREDFGDDEKPSPTHD